MSVQIQLRHPVVLVNVVKTTRGHIVVTATVQGRLSVQMVYVQVSISFLRVFFYIVCLLSYIYITSAIWSLIYFPAKQESCGNRWSNLCTCNNTRFLTFSFLKLEIHTCKNPSHFQFKMLVTVLIHVHFNNITLI